MDADQIAAPAAVDVDQRQVEDAPFDINRQRLLRPERAGATDQEAGVAVGDLGLARLDLLAADLPGQFLGRYLAVAVHQDEQGPGVLVLEDQGLDHAVLGDVEFARRDLGPAVLLVGVEVAGKGHALRLEELGGRGFGGVVGFAHGDVKGRVQPRG